MQNAEGTAELNASFCYTSECGVVNGMPNIYVQVNENVYECRTSGQIIITTNPTGRLVCPDIAKFCKIHKNENCLRGCNGNGRCNSNGKCDCYYGYEGDDCSPIGCFDGLCGNNGICAEDLGICVCRNGFRGNLCDIPLNAIY
jgi:hypothetical protein